MWIYRREYKELYKDYLGWKHIAEKQEILIDEQTKIIKDSIELIKEMRKFKNKS